MKKGIDLLRDKHAYRSLAFTREERERLGLRGLLPYPVIDQSQLVERVMLDLRKQAELLRLQGRRAESDIPVVNV